MWDIQIACLLTFRLLTCGASKNVNEAIEQALKRYNQTHEAQRSAEHVSQAESSSSKLARTRAKPKTSR